MTPEYRVYLESQKHRYYRRNADEPLRRLERAVAAGDTTQQAALEAERRRVGLCLSCGGPIPEDHELCLKCRPYELTWDTVQIFNDQVQFLMEEEDVSEAVARSMTELDQELYTFEWEHIVEELTEWMNKINPDGKPWCVEGHEMGWQHRSEEMMLPYNDATTGQELLNRILPRTENTFTIYYNGEDLRIKNAHHDAPMGETYQITVGFSCEECGEDYCTEKAAAECCGTLVVVDVQPEYENDFHFDIKDFCHFVKQHSYPNTLVLYNGEFTIKKNWSMNMISEEDLRDYYEKHSEFPWVYHPLNNAEYHDKGYAFFRNCMDEGFANDVIIPVVKYMWKNNISDSRNIDWDEIDPQILVQWNKGIIRFLQSEEMINIPDLMDVLNEATGHIHLVGGSTNECLREVVIALEALERDYTIDATYTY